MEKENKKKEKTVAWNRVAFQVPGNWEPAEINPCRLLLEDQGEPVFEIRWNRVKGKVSHKKILTRLARAQERKAGKALKPEPLPKDRERMLSGFEASGFSWESRGQEGKGVFLYCPACKNATLLQFLGPAAKKGRLQSDLLRSFSDHREDENILWTVFDIHALVPSGLKLVGHRFKPGLFELDFKGQGKALRLHRWGPASVILRNRDLADWAQQSLSFPDQAREKEASKIMAEWDVPAPSGLSGALWRRVKGRPPFWGRRVWANRDKNRILGVDLEGSLEGALPLFERICSDYGLV